MLASEFGSPPPRLVRRKMSSGGEPPVIVQIYCPNASSAGYCTLKVPQGTNAFDLKVIALQKIFKKRSSMGLKGEVDYSCYELCPTEFPIPCASCSRPSYITDSIRIEELLADGTITSVQNPLRLFVVEASALKEQFQKPASPRAGAAPLSPPRIHSLVTAVRTLSWGNSITRLIQTANFFSSVLQECLVLYHPPLASLPDVRLGFFRFISMPVEPHKAGDAFALHHLWRVCIGKLHVSFRAKTMAMVDRERCCTLSFRNRHVHILCDDQDAFVTWLASLYGLLRAGNVHCQLVPRSKHEIVEGGGHAFEKFDNKSAPVIWEMDRDLAMTNALTEAVHAIESNMAAFRPEDSFDKAVNGLVSSIGSAADATKLGSPTESGANINSAMLNTLMDGRIPDLKAASASSPRHRERSSSESLSGLSDSDSDSSDSDSSSADDDDGGGGGDPADAERRKQRRHRRRKSKRRKRKRRREQLLLQQQQQQQQQQQLLTAAAVAGASKLPSPRHAIPGAAGSASSPPPPSSRDAVAVVRWDLIPAPDPSELDPAESIDSARSAGSSTSSIKGFAGDADGGSLLSPTTAAAAAAAAAMTASSAAAGKPNGGLFGMFSAAGMFRSMEKLPLVGRAVGWLSPNRPEEQPTTDENTSRRREEEDEGEYDEPDDEEEEKVKQEEARDVLPSPPVSSIKPLVELAAKPSEPEARVPASVRSGTPFLPSSTLSRNKLQQMASKAGMQLESEPERKDPPTRLMRGFSLTKLLNRDRDNDGDHAESDHDDAGSVMDDEDVDDSQSMAGTETAAESSEAVEANDAATLLRLTKLMATPENVIRGISTPIQEVRSVAEDRRSPPLTDFKISEDVSRLLARAASAPLPARLLGSPSSDQGLMTPQPASGGAAPRLQPAGKDADPVMERLLTTGEVFTKYAMRNGQVSRVRVFKSLDQQTGEERLFWCAADSRKQEHSRSIAIGDIKSVLVGKSTDTWTRSKTAASANAACCFSVCAAGRTLDLEASTPQLRSKWVETLKYLLNTRRPHRRG